jgi:hypothetical protein
VVDQATLFQGESHRTGLDQCNACREPFTVATGTLVESGKIPLSKRSLAFDLRATSRRRIGPPAAPESRDHLGITYKSTWLVAHHIRNAKGGGDGSPMGGAVKPAK